MIKKSLPFLAAFILAGCAGGFHHVNPNNQKVRFSDPVLAETDTVNLTYVLLEKEPGGNQYRLVSISKVKPKIANVRQERVAFNADLTRFAVDYDEYDWETFVDYQNYSQKTRIMVCQGKYRSIKTQRYNPCTSDFKAPFIPTSVTKAYVAGRMPYEARKLWDNPNWNNKVVTINPWQALSESGAIHKLGIKRVETQ